jgi:hypothetical protein
VNIRLAPANAIPIVPEPLRAIDATCNKRFEGRDSPFNSESRENEKYRSQLLTLLRQFLCLQFCSRSPTSKLPLLTQLNLSSTSRVCIRFPLRFLTRVNDIKTSTNPLPRLGSPTCLANSTTCAPYQSQENGIIVGHCPP